MHNDEMNSLLEKEVNGVTYATGKLLLCRSKLGHSVDFLYWYSRGKYSLERVNRKENIVPNASCYKNKLEDHYSSTAVLQFLEDHSSSIAVFYNQRLGGPFVRYCSIAVLYSQRIRGPFVQHCSIAVLYRQRHALECLKLNCREWRALKFAT